MIEPDTDGGADAMDPGPVGSQAVPPSRARRRDSRRDFLKVADQYYVLATSVLADHETRVLKQGETFAVFDPYGDIQPVTHAESGIFHRGTRYLSMLELNMIYDERPLLLNSTLRDDNGVLKVDLTNRDFDLPGKGFVPKGTLHVHREKFLLDSKCFEEVTISNFARDEMAFDMSYRLEADFKDIFEVRGTRRARHGRKSRPEIHGARVRFVYQGLDGVRRVTCFAMDIDGGVVIDEGNHIRFRVHVPARGRISFRAVISFHEQSETEGDEDFGEGLKKIFSDHSVGKRKFSVVRSSNEQFDLWMRRSTDDLVMMTTLTGGGELYPYAGIPWFCASFGRDGLLTAYECLWANPQLAKGVLEYLARTQSREVNPERDSTPGKIIHEARHGEMANLNEIPFGRYYGSIDSTPLFVGLGGAYLERTDDLETVTRLWPAFREALTWLDRYGDRDGDGFIEYQRENLSGLIHQGWKDSTDSVFHADGADAAAPIALCEVQAYAYWARVEGARMAKALGDTRMAEALLEKAMALKANFDRAFWLEDLGTYALALDAEKRPCRLKSSNAGQCLFTGIVRPERVPRLVSTLMQRDSYSGWGIRTIASDAVRFNPMSYHNGSVWPHDVALIAWGLAKYGHKHEVERLFMGLFGAANYMENFRMPEVFCGFERREGEAPTLYPHACAPQAWSAASVYLMVQAILGLSIDGREKKLTFFLPRLPGAIESLKVSGLLVGGDSVDVIVQNYHSDVSVQILRRAPGVTVTVVK